MYSVMRMLSKFLFTISVCLLMSFGSGSSSTLNASFIFGDSLVDGGNNDYLLTLSKANYPPFGIDLSPHRQPTGRFTNGRTIADILGQEVGLKNWVPPYLDPSATGPAVLQGVNYASGGGGLLKKTGKFFGASLNLYTQIDCYSKTRQDIISSVGRTAALRLLRKEALFSVTIGSNDFINNYLIPILSVPKRAVISPEMFVESLVSSYRQQLKRLYYLDARKILVVNVGPIGCIPYMREQSLSSSTKCFDLANQLAENFNSRLKDLVQELSSSLDGSIFVYANVNSIVSDIIQNYRHYGFEVADSACCRTAGRYGGLIPCCPKAKICLDRTKYVFWDPYHPTETTNIIIAKQLLDGNSNVIFPMNIRQLSQA